MTDKEQLEEKLNYFYKNGLFDKYYEQLKIVKQCYKVYRNSHGDHIIKLNTSEWLNSLFGL